MVADCQRAFGAALRLVTAVSVLTDADALKIDLDAWCGDTSLTAYPGWRPRN